MVLGCTKIYSKGINYVLSFLYVLHCHNHEDTSSHIYIYIFLYSCCIKEYIFPFIYIPFPYSFCKKRKNKNRECIWLKKKSTCDKVIFCLNQAKSYFTAGWFLFNQMPSLVLLLFFFLPRMTSTGVSIIVAALELIRHLST